MKKTLVALAVTAFAASSAHAFTAYENEGTKVTFDGSLRMLMDKYRTEDANGKETTSKLKNSGSRMAVRTQHDLSDGFFAFSRFELRFDGKNKGDDNFGDIYAKRAYVGLGKKEFGEVSFGRQLTIADDITINTDYAYGLINDYVRASGNSVIRYDYKGIEGLQVGANYNFAQKTNDKGGALSEPYKNAYGVGLTYENSGFDFRAAYGRTNYETNSNAKHHDDAVEVGIAQRVGDVRYILDAGYKFDKEGSVKTNTFFVSPGLQYFVTPKTRIHGNYLFEQEKVKNASTKVTTHGGLVGADYKFHKQALVFVEGVYKRTKDTADNSRVKDKAIGVGMRVFW
jgi:predicted porin